MLEIGSSASPAMGLDQAMALRAQVVRRQAANLPVGGQADTSAPRNKARAVRTTVVGQEHVTRE